jgi:hypothetical protein
MKIYPTLEKCLDLTGLKDHDCHRELPRDGEFKGIGLGGGSICLEEALFIAGVLGVVKPDHVIELGTSQGGSTVAIASVMKDILPNSKFTTVDLAPVPPKTAKEIDEALDLGIEWVLSTNSLDYLKKFKIEPGLRYLVFSDTEIKVRPDEVSLVLGTFPFGTYIIVHDTSDLHPFGPMNLRDVISIDDDIVDLPSPRGISILEVR